MSAQTLNAPPSPYRGILPFRYADRANFFGREREISELVAKILNYRLVVLFGDSGAGKSSLINAGIVPRLESEGFQPERLRVRPFKENPFLVERIASGRQDPRFLLSVFALEGSSDSREVYCSLEGFEKAVSHASPERPLVLILDQFEELFTLFEAADRDLQERILAVIANAANRKDLAAKIVLGIREDFLGKLELISKEYPQVFDRRVRLDLLDSKAATRAVIGPFERKGEFAAEISADTADAIIGEFEKGTEHTGIHPTQLQIVCSRLWEEYAGGSPVITRDHFLTMKGVKGILEGFLESTVAALSPGQKDLAYGVLGQLITASGTRDVVSEAKLKAWYAQTVGGDEKPLADVLCILDEQRLINRTSQHSLFYYEVSSEYLVNPIKEYNRVRECRDAERKAAEVAANEANEAARVRELEQARLLAAEQTRVAEAERQRAELEALNVKRLKRRNRFLVGVLIYGIISVAAFLYQYEEVRSKRDDLKAANTTLTQRTTDLEEALRLQEANNRAREESLRAERLRADQMVQPTKQTLETYRNDLDIKQAVLSGDRARIDRALRTNPSKIRFTVDAISKDSNIAQKQIYRFEMKPVPDSIEGGLESLALITMLMDHPTFKNPVIAAGPEQRFMCSYEGWGYLNRVVAVIEFKNPLRRAEVAVFNMGELLSRKYGYVQKR
jgi:hypothetical protein